MYFFEDFEAALRGILEQVGQKAASKDAEKDAKSEVLEYRDRFVLLQPGQKVKFNESQMRELNLSSFEAEKDGWSTSTILKQPFLV
jgi:hypothetical protein